MSAVDQILITHCTYGNSALERREGEFAHRMLGYSARAGSVDPLQLRHYYRQVERYAYYYLPRDTPGEEKLRLTAATAPMRLVYMPGSGGVEMLSLVSYRQTDTEGRPGSYFAHVLLRDQQNPEAGWSSLDCLRLWDAAGWMREDSPAIPFALPKLGLLQELTRGLPVAIEENVLISFLTTPAGGKFFDPRGVITPRWRQAEPALRQESFFRALDALMATAGQARNSALIGIEPGMAALVFFGVLRLLPAAARRQISFSTFEPNPERIVTTLAATWFFAPDRAELRSDALRGRGVVVSTLERDLAQPWKGASSYARIAVDRLVQTGFAGVDALLQTFQAVGASSLADLERLAGIESFLGRLFVADAAPLDLSWRQSPVAETYLRRRLTQELTARGDVRASLRPLFGSAQHLLLAELLAGQPAACDFLLSTLPEGRVAEAIASTAIPHEAKVALLVRLIAANGRLPLGCEPLLGAAGDGGMLMSEAISRLNADQVDRLRAGIAQEQTCALLAALVAASIAPSPAREGLTRMVRSLETSEFLGVFATLGPGFFKQYPQDEPALGERLSETLAVLADEPSRFSPRLDLLLAAQHLLPTDAAQESVAAWSRVRRSMLEIGGLQKKKGGLFGGQSNAVLEKACRTMAEAFRQAWKDERKDEELEVHRKEQRLFDLGCGVLGEPLLPRSNKRNHALWMKIGYALEHGQWSLPNLHKGRAGGKGGKRPPAAAVAMIVLSLAAIGFALFYFSPWWPASEKDGGAEVAQRPEAVKKPPVVAEKRPAEKKPDATKNPADGGSGSESRPAEGQAAKDPQEEPNSEPMDDDAGTPIAQDPVEQMPEDANTQDGPAEESTTDDEPATAEPVVAEPVKSAAEREAEWLAAARRYAAAHHGCVVEGAELDQGEYLFPAGAIEVAEAPATVVLGSGWIKLDGHVFKFGDDFQGQPPKAGHEVPLLAEKLGFASLEISVQARDSGVWLLARGTPHRADQSAIVAIKGEIDKVKSRQNRLISKITEWEKLLRRPDSDEKKARVSQLRDVLIDEAQIELPPRAEPPDRSSPQFSKENDKEGDHYFAAEREYENRRKQREQAIAAAPDVAKQKLKGLTDKIKGLEGQIQKINVDTRIGNDDAAKAWKSCHPTVAAIIYQADAGKASPSPAPAGVAAAQGTVAGDDRFVKVDGTFKVDTTENGYKAEIPYIGKVKVSAVNSLPKWAKDGAIVNVAIREHTEEGEVRNYTVIEVTKAKEHLILGGTTRLEIRYEFLPKGHSAGGDLGAGGATSWESIDQVPAGCLLTIKFEAEKNAWDGMKK